MAKELAKNDGPILVLNSGSSSLKFGIYQPGATDEEPLLTGSAEGIGRDNGTLHIRSSDGKPLLQRDCIHESQSDALGALAAVKASPPVEPLLPEPVSQAAVSPQAAVNTPTPPASQEAAAPPVKPVTLAPV